MKQGTSGYTACSVSRKRALDAEILGTGKRRIHARHIRKNGRRTNAREEATLAENKIYTILEDLKTEEERLKKELADVRKREQDISRELRCV